MRSLILASSSPRRKGLLKQLGLQFVVVPSLIEEKLNPRLKPKGQAEVLSVQKAEAVVKKLGEKKHSPVALILAADTLVAIDDEVLGKPKDAKDARRMLKKLSGKRHCVITGFSLFDLESKKMLTESVETFVYFRKLSEREIRAYVQREKLLDKAGAYAIQGIGAVFIEKIEGDYFNVVGLPLYALSLALRKFGVEVISV